MNSLLASADAALDRILLHRAPSAAAALSIYAIVSMALALWTGKDLNWDLLNYHYYNGWAFLHGRSGADIAPAQLQTWFNPLLDVPLAWSIRHLPPLAVGLLYAAVQSLNAGCVRALAKQTLPGSDTAVRDWAAFALGLASLAGAIYRAEAGGGMGDTLASIPLLGSLVLLTRSAPSAATAPAWQPYSRWAAAGGLAGAAAGLKLTLLIYVLGFGLATLLLAAPSRRQRLTTLCFFAGAFAGWIVFDGLWRLALWQAYANPLFPLMNQVFRSPFAAALPFSDTRFLPDSAWRAAIYPVVWLFDPNAVSDSGRFVDLRLPLCYVLGLAWLATSAVRRDFHRVTAPARFLLSGSLLAYLLWLGLFGIYRYLVVLELLAPLLLAQLLCAFGGVRREQRVHALGFFAIVCLAVLPLAQTRGGWRGESYFDARIPAEARSIEHATVILAGQAPLSFVLPDLPDDWRFVRIASNFQSDATTGTELDRHIDEAVERSSGPLLGLASGSELVQFDRAAARLRLARDPAHPCDAIPSAAMLTRPIPVFTQPLLLCRLVQR